MKKIMLTAIFIACCASLGLAQEKSKVEGYVGFSVDSIDTGLQTSLQGTGLTATNADNRETGIGFQTSVTGFFNDKFGIEGNVDGNYKNKTFTVSDGVTTADFRARISSYNFMAGPHVRFVSADSKVTPFVHALIGANHTRLTGSALGITERDSQTDLALKLGGGVDFGLSNRVDLRLAGDYNPIFERNSNNGFTNNNRTRNDAIFSVGVVIK